MLLLYLQVFKCMRLLTKAIRNMRKNFSMCLMCFNTSTLSHAHISAHDVYILEKCPWCL